MPAIEIEHLGFCYEARRQCFRAIDEITLSIPAGQFVCVIGPSGCGKTTLLRLLSGLQRPTVGQVKIGGKIVQGPGTDRAVVFQNYTLFPWMTALKNVAFAARQAKKGLGRAEGLAKAAEFLQKVEMAEAVDKYPYQLSGGMRQRVAIARALAMDADILLLDEPFGALDAKIRGALQTLLEALWVDGGRRQTVIFVTHDIREAVRLADRILFMQPGRIAADIPVKLPRPRENLGPEDAARQKALRRELLQGFHQSARPRAAGGEGCCCEGG